MFVVASYLNQQKHFVCGLFDPPYLEANIIMFAEFTINLGRLVVTPCKDTYSQPVYPQLAASARRTWTTSQDEARISLLNLLARGRKCS